MKKIIVLIFILLFINRVNSQLDTIANAEEFRTFVYACIDSLIDKDKKYLCTKGIDMEFNLKGELLKYKLYVKDLRIRKRDYNWLFDKLSKRNYLHVASLYDDPDFPKQNQNLRLSIKYVPKEK